MHETQSQSIENVSYFLLGFFNFFFLSSIALHKWEVLCYILFHMTS